MSSDAEPLTTTTASAAALNVLETLNDAKVFPETKIKAQLRRHPSFGRIVETTMQTVRVGSLLLTQGIVEGILEQQQQEHASAAEGQKKKASAKAAPSVVIRLADVQAFIRQHEQEYHFVNGRIHKMAESEAAIRKNTKRPKRNPPQEQESQVAGTNLEAPLQEAMALAEKQAPTSLDNDVIVADEDDYD